MSNKVIGSITVAIVLVLGGIGAVIWKVAQQPASTVAKQAVKTPTTSLPNSTSAGNLSVSNSNPTQMPTPAINDPATKQVEPTTGVTLDPAKFSQYESFKDKTVTSFVDLNAGTGNETVKDKQVAVIYRGWLTDGKVFDESTDQSKPFTFTLGNGSVIPGWDQGVAGMKVGGERLLIIPPSVGYGATGTGPIPGNAVLIFDVKLIAVE